MPQLQQRQIATPHLPTLRVLQRQRNRRKRCRGVTVSRDQILDKVTEIIANQLLIEKTRITMESRFVEDLHADSLDIIDWIVEIENAFGIEIPDDEIKKINSVVELVKLINSRF